MYNKGRFFYHVTHRRVGRMAWPKAFGIFLRGKVLENFVRQGLGNGMCVPA